MPNPKNKKKNNPKRNRLIEESKKKSVERMTTKKPLPSYEEMLLKVTPPKTAMDSVRTMHDKSMKKDTMKQMKKKDMMYGGKKKTMTYGGKKMKYGGMKKGKKY